MGTFEEAARPEFEPVEWVGPGRAEVEWLVQVVLVEVDLLQVLVAESRQHP